MKFNEKLLELRKLKGWSQEQLGEKVNVSRQTVSKWELGVTTPELNKLIELSEVFNCSIDEFVGKKKADEPVTNKTNIFAMQHFEYKSKLHLGKLPLVHINLGLGSYKAKGIIAIGNIAMGIISFGIVSIGLLSLGAVGIGLLALAGLALGGIALGGLSIGVVALGGLALGVFATGGLAIGVYSIGGCAIASNIAVGGYANGHIAIGDVVNGDFKFLAKDMVLIDKTPDDLRRTILQEFPNTFKFIVDLFCSFVK